MISFKKLVLSQESQSSFKKPYGEPDVVTPTSHEYTQKTEVGGMSFLLDYAH